MTQLIFLILVQFIKNDDLIGPCEKWEDRPVNTCTYGDFHQFMIKQVIRTDNRKGTLGTLGTAKIANLVEEPIKQSTKILSGELLVQAETICQL